jgi:hypothetical protein
MRVRCDIDYGETENERGFPVACVEATCGRCGHTTTAYGDSSASVRAALVMMREECPEGESNFYVASEGEDER